jgi:hypothetical protein
LKALVARFAASSEVDMNGLVNEETSMEASILHDLEGAMVQMSEKTRICFRDAFYRLAKNSEQYVENHCQSGDLISDELPQLTIHDKTLRLESMKTMESKTNSVDRAVANLLFSKMDSEKEPTRTSGQCNYSLSPSQLPHYPQHTSLVGDAEVPVFSKGKQREMQVK